MNFSCAGFPQDTSNIVGSYAPAWHDRDAISGRSNQIREAAEPV
jgi:hypothetical protein